MPMHALKKCDIGNVFVLLMPGINRIKNSASKFVFLLIDRFQERKRETYSVS